MAIKPINTCVLGVGLAGLTFHVPFILGLPDLFTLHSVLERNPQSPGGKVQARFGVTPKIHRTLDDVLADPEVELIIVGTPNSTHYSFAKAALEAGKHVLVDKPVTATVKEAEELGALAKSKNLVIYGFQNRRWDADYLALRKLLALPESSPQSIGAVTEFESVFDRFRPALKGSWKDDPLPGAGATYDLGAHLIDQALQLFGRPARLTALMQNTRGIGHPDVEDTFTVFLHYPAGAARPHPLLATLRSHILSVRSPQPRFIVRGAKGTLTKGGVDVQEDQLRAMAAPQAIFGAAFGREPEAQYGVLETLGVDGVSVKQSTWPSVDAGSQVSLFRDLAAAIRLGTTPSVKWEESTAVIEMIELAHLSAKEGRTLEVPKK